MNQRLDSDRGRRALLGRERGLRGWANGMGLLLALVWCLRPIPLVAQPAAPANLVLDLDGQSGYVELPPNIFDDLDEATVEAWVQWRTFPTNTWARFFSYGEQDHDTGIDVNRGGGLHFFVADSEARPRPVTSLRVPGAIRTNEWYHVAAVSGPGGKRLLLDGNVIATNRFSRSFSAIRNGAWFRLGRSVVDGEPFVDGRLDDVRVWSIARSDEEIRESMFARLNGREPGLAGLWNFDNGTANDATLGAHHGTMIGAVKITEAALPAPTELAPWSRLRVKTTDRNGTELPNVTIRAEVNGTELASATTDGTGVAYLTPRTAANTVDLAASGAGDLVASRAGMAIVPYEERSLDLVLRPTLHVAGKVTALDGKTPHVWLVLELVRPAGAEVENSQAQQSGKLVDPLDPAPRRAAANGVLRLDSSNSHVELPRDIFVDLEEATVEGWVKWESFGNNSRFFDFTLSGYWLDVQNRETTDTLWLEKDTESGQDVVRLPGQLSRGVWTHVAAVSGRDGLKLFADGVLRSTNAILAHFPTVDVEKRNYLGRSNWRLSSLNDADFHGQIDEVRVWKGTRTEAQIRENLFKKLTGTEPDLVGLWNFDDPAQPGRDSSSGGHHGKLMGQATVTNESLPAVVFGTITDPYGQPASAARIELRHQGGQERRFLANSAGEYAITMDPSMPCDLFVTTGTLSAYRLDFQPAGEGERRLDWTLAATQGGWIGSAPGRGADGFKSEIGNRKSEIPQFPSGNVVARTLTDENGAFDFANVKPGRYQLRAVVLDGKAWFDSGRIQYLRDDTPDGEAALKIAQRARPDVILLDVMMPKLDGFETCRRLKQNEATRAIPVLFITAREETQSVKEGFQAGGVDYLTKPFQAEEVLIRLKTHLQNSRLTRVVVEKNKELESTNERLRLEIARREQAEQSLQTADEQLSLISELEAERWGLTGLALSLSLAMLPNPRR